MNHDQSAKVHTLISNDYVFSVIESTEWLKADAAKTDVPRVC